MHAQPPNWIWNWLGTNIDMRHAACLSFINLHLRRTIDSCYHYFSIHCINKTKMTQPHCNSVCSKRSGLEQKPHPKSFDVETSRPPRPLYLRAQIPNVSQWEFAQLYPGMEKTMVQCTCVEHVKITQACRCVKFVWIRKPNLCTTKPLIIPGVFWQFLKAPWPRPESCHIWHWVW